MGFIQSQRNQRGSHSTPTEIKITTQEEFLLVHSRSRDWNSVLLRQRELCNGSHARGKSRYLFHKIQDGRHLVQYSTKYYKTIPKALSKDARQIITLALTRKK